MSTPKEHVVDAHELVADGEVDLFELVPNDGSGTVYLKSDNPVTWQGNTYEGLPLKIIGLKKSVDGSAVQPKLMFGDGSIDLSPFKPIVYDGYLDNAKVTHIVVLLDHVQKNVNIRRSTEYRVKRVPMYNRQSIELTLATASDALGFTLPHRQYAPPAFPAVSQ